MNTYCQEWTDSLTTLKNQQVNSNRFQYFFEIAQRYFDPQYMEKRTPKFILIGTSIPEELIYSVGKTPFWILGGSLGTFDAADSLVPRDTDAVSQSILGYLKNEDYSLLKKATIILPITCDSMRKVVSILEKDANVITIDIPPDKKDPKTKEKWISQMHRIAEQISSKAKKIITKKSFHYAVQMVNTARKEMERFDDLARNGKTNLTGSMVLFLLNTYYFTDNILEWTKQLHELNETLDAEAQLYTTPKNRKPRILLMASPIYFPNYKIPLLVENLGMDIHTVANVMTQKIFTDSRPLEKNSNLDSHFNHIVWNHYEADCSTAYINNISLFQNIEKLTKEGSFDGVIYHVLKGQIEYDFELNRYEDFFANINIPVFRLETDYKYQDIEQLKIRVEAFKEMLVQNLYRKERSPS